MVGIFDRFETNTVRCALKIIERNLTDLLDLKIESDHSYEGRQYYHLERGLIAKVLKDGDPSLLNQSFDTETRMITAEDSPEVLCISGLVTKEIYDSVRAKTSEALRLPPFEEWEEKMKELRQHYGYAEPVVENPVPIINNSSFFYHPNSESPSPHSLEPAEAPSNGAVSPQTTELSEEDNGSKHSGGLK